MSEVTTPATNEKVERVSYLDQALWTELGQAKTEDDYARFWLALQCRMIGSVVRAVVLFGPPDTGPFNPVATWPEEGGDQADLMGVADRALKERRGVGFALSNRRYHAAYPFIFGERLHGVIGMELGGEPDLDLRTVMRQLQWGAAWIEALRLREACSAGEAGQDRTSVTLDLAATAVDEVRFRAAAMSVVTEMAMRLDCDRVSVGFVTSGNAEISAISHTAKIGGRMNLVRMIGAAMDEAIDQGTLQHYSLIEGANDRVLLAHAELSRVHGAGAILTIPFMVEGEFLGAFTFERPSGMNFDMPTIELCECAAALVGPILDEKRRNDSLLIVKAAASCKRQLQRLFGPQYWGRKLAAAVLMALVAFFSFAHADYRVVAESTIEGKTRRTLIAPIDGYVDAEHARAGDVVSENQVLATLDVTDLSLERLRWIATRQQRLLERDKALASRDRAQVKVVDAQIAQADAQIKLVEQKIRRATVRAPFDGFVLLGDLSQSVGGSVERGEVLFEVAPLNAYRLVLNVDERDVTEVEPGQTGSLVLSSLPNEPLAFRVLRLTPVSEARDGGNFFEVEAELLEESPALRPGMQGFGKILIDRRRLIWIWTHSLFEWLRLSVWSWWP